MYYMVYWLDRARVQYNLLDKAWKSGGTGGTPGVFDGRGDGIINGTVSRYGKA
jgi:hypothetical protein